MIIEVITIILTIVILCFSIIALSNVVPFIKQKTIEETTKEKLDAIQFYGREEDGVDRALLLETPIDALNARIEVLKNAKKKISIVYHLFHGDGSSMLIFDELWKAANRGVKIRIIIDGKIKIDNKIVSDYLLVLTSHPNIEYKIYNPLLLLKPHKWQLLLHDKFMIIDDQYLVLGGRNISDRHFGAKNFKKSLSLDRDVFVFRTGNLDKKDDSVIHQINQYMESLWNCPDTKYINHKKIVNEKNRFLINMEEQANIFRTENPIFFKKTLDDYYAESCPTKKITLISNPINTKIKEPWLAYLVNQLVFQANHKVVLQTPYMTANSKLLDRLKRLNDKVNEVELLTNSVASSPNFPAFSNYFITKKKFSATGIKIYEYQKEDSIHGKSMIVDNDLSIVGSLNLDDRSFYLDTETMLVIHSIEFTRVLQEAMNEIKEKSLVVDNQTGNYIMNSNVVPLQVNKRKIRKMKLFSIFSRLFQFLI